MPVKIRIPIHLGEVLDAPRLAGHECDNPAHAGLRRFYTHYPPYEREDVAWMGEDVQLLHLKIRSMDDELRRYQTGTTRTPSAAAVVAIVSTLLNVGFALYILTR